MSVAVRLIAFVVCMGFFFPNALFSHSRTSIGVASLASRSAIAKNSLQKEGPLIVLDAGHGGSDEGARVRQLQEKSITLLTALYAKKQLEQMGYRVLLTRSKDIYVSLPKRVSLANKTESTIFVSIHFNSAKNALAEGIEIFFFQEKSSRTSASKQLAQFVLQGVVGQTDSFSRGVKSGNFYVIRETQMPSIIVEAGFMTNNSEWSCLRKKSYLERISKGIALGVDKYLRS